jgi:hypothetical protein
MSVFGRKYIVRTVYNTETAAEGSVLTGGRKNGFAEGGRVLT